MTNKGEECYSRVFEFIKENFPKFNPCSYMSDFEIGFHNAIEAAFPNIEVNHCYFHYAQVSLKIIYTFFQITWLFFYIIDFVLIIPYSLSSIESTKICF